MADELAVPVSPSPRPSLPFYDVWNTALRRPSVEAYERLLEDPKANLSRAVVWLLVVGAISSVLSAVSQLIWVRLMSSGALSQLAAPGQTLPSELALPGLSMAALLACAVPAGAIGMVLGQLLYFGLVHFTASAFGGQGTFGRMVYANAAYYAPVTLLSSLLALIPCAACLAVPLGVYSIALQFIAVKAATRLGWGGTIGSILIVLFLFILVTVVLALLLMGPIMDQLRTIYPIT